MICPKCGTEMKSYKIDRHYIVSYICNECGNKEKKQK